MVFVLFCVEHRLGPQVPSRRSWREIVRRSRLCFSLINGRKIEADVYVWIMLRLDRHSLVQQLLRGLGSTDSSLPAFAQLAAWRLDADSALISLRDADREYVLCRRGRLDSLLDPNGEVVSASTLCADGPSVFAFDHWLSCMSAEPGTPLKALSGEDHLKAGAQSCVSAVPIVHSCGHLIGCLSVVSQKPRTLSISDSSFLSELASTIANHLDLRRSQSSHRRDQRMIRGLEAFQARDSPVPGESSAQIHAGARAEDACAQISLGKRVFEAFINDTVRYPHFMPPRQGCV